MMKLSLNWLSDFISFSENSPEKIAERLTLGVAEVEHVEVQGALLEKCVVGKILTLGKHPNADKLSLCSVQTDQGKKQVVCGGTNLREGMLVAFAHVGAHVRHEEEKVELKAMKIRGEVSEGMICAAGELELSDLYPPKKEEGNRPVVDLGNDGFIVGQSLREALGLSDTVFHIDNHAITHRPDLFSHIGFARECVALGLGTWKKRPGASKPSFAKNPVPFKFIVDDPKLMPRYLGCMIEISDLGETPDWMKARLSAVGWRSLNLPIDITNFVASEVGVPLHSFDADDIRGTVHMRAAKKGEKIVTLDHKEHTLPAGALILSDDEGIFDLLGIMGGLRSSTKEGTKHIYLHSASLDPLSIRRTVIATGHRTDAATVYEKGVPPVTTEAGFYRALELFLAHVPGARVTSLLETFGDNGTAKVIPLSPARATHFLGREVSEKEATTILNALDFSVTVGKGVGAYRDTPLQVTVPLHRLGDIRIEVDLFEEIARIAGFRSFTPELPEAGITPPERDHRVHRLRETLKELGCIELVQFAFAGKNLLLTSGVDMKNLDVIENPIGEDMSILRPSLVPRLLEYAAENIDTSVGAYRETPLQLFEIGNVFFGEQEETRLTLLVAEKRKEGLTSEPFLRAKMLLQEMAKALALPCTISREKSPSKEKHPVRSTKVLLGKKTEGHLYEVHPSITKTLGFPGRVAVADISITELLAEPKAEHVYKEAPIFPVITYDTTVALSSSQEVEKLLKKIQGSCELLREITLVDLFQKPKSEQRHLTFRCVYSAPDRTLTEAEVKPIHEQVEEALRTS